MRVKCPFCGAETNAADTADQVDCPSCGQVLSVLREAQTLTRAAAQEPQEVETSSAEAATVTRPQVRVNCFQCSREFTIPLGEKDSVCPRCGAPYSLAGTGDRAAPTPEAAPDAPTVASGHVAEPPSKSQETSAEASLRWLQEHFEGRYEILDFVGRGGMGAVFRARQKQPAREIAMKVMLAGTFATETNRKRFEREANAVARLNHPAIVPVYEFGEVGGQPYFTMEFVDGRNLRSHVAQKNLSREQICRLMVRVCDAIHYAHQHGVIHRDLKPGNVMVDALERPRILDFGLSRASVEGEGTYDGLTVTGEYMGTPRYMSPEQAMGSPRGVDERTDVYALGVILYEMIVGVLPYPVEHVKGLKAYEMLQKHEPLRPSVLHPNMPRDLELILLKAVQKDKEQRYQTADALARDLENYLEDRPITARPTTLSYRFNKWAWRHRRVLGPMVVAAVAIAGVSYVYWRQTASLEAAKEQTENERDASDAQRRAVVQALELQRGEVKSDVEQDRWMAAESVAVTLARANPREPLLNTLPQFVRRKADRRVQDALDQFAALVRQQYYDEAQKAAEKLAVLAPVMPYDDLSAKLTAAAGDFQEACWIDLKAAVADACTPGQASEHIRRFMERWPDGPHSQEARTLAAQQAALGTEHFLKQAERAIARALDEYRWKDAATALESARGLLKAGEEAQSGDWPGVLGALQARLDAAIRPDNAARVTPTAPSVSVDGYLKALVFAPDGSWFAAASLPNRVTVWSWPGRRELRTWQTEGEVRSLAVSPDGALVAAGDKDGEVQVRSAKDGRLLRRMATGTDWVATLQFSADATRLLTGTSGGVALWDVTSGKRLKDVFQNAERPAVLAPDGDCLAAALPKAGIGVWQMDRPERLFTIDATGKSPAVLCFSPDGRLLASAHTGDKERRVRLWDTVWGEPAMDVVVSPEPGSLFARLAWGLAFSPDGRLLATGDAHGTIKLWDVGSHEAVKEFSAHQKAITCAAFSPDARALVTGANDGLMHFWGIAPLPSAH